MLFALALGSDAATLARVAGGVLWVAVLLSGLLALDTLFRGDAEDGSLEQWLLAPVPLAWLVLVRVFTHWATTALPLLLATPLLAELLGLPRAQWPVLLAHWHWARRCWLLSAVVAALTSACRSVSLSPCGTEAVRAGEGSGAGSVAASAKGSITVRPALIGDGLVLAWCWPAGRGGGDPDRVELSSRHRHTPDEPDQDDRHHGCENSQCHRPHRIATAAKR